MKLKLFRSYFFEFLDDLRYIVFPEYCAACGILLVKKEKILCTNCWSDIPYVYLSNYTNNEIIDLLAGRVPVVNAFSLFYYVKNNRFQNIIKDFKYNGRKHIGYEFGKIIGKKIKGTSFEDVDLILPVPLYKKRLKERGFNQSELIANGISEIINKPVILNAIERIEFKDSQTTKSKYDRWLNVEGKFKIINPDIFFEKHIMLVDDVITTGATIEAISQEILKISDSKISLVTMCLASKY